MKTLEAPDTEKSYVTMGGNTNQFGRRSSYVTNGKDNDDDDNEGLPRTYDKAAIERYWSKERGALNQRWGQFVGKAVPFFTRLITLYIRDGKIAESEIPQLSKQARMDLQDLGPTFIKAGQMMSVRPDVLPPATLSELEKLQDSVQPFATDIAVQVIEQELGGPLHQFFTTISEEPVAAASLAQVYVATLLDGVTKVAIKVQRPDVLGTVSKDLYVLRRAAEVVNDLVRRFAPQQRTNYVALLNEWAIGFYTELDFANEAYNQQRLRQILLDRNVTSVMIPKVYEELCTRRILVSEWIDGKKLSDCSTDVIADVTPAAQEAFLLQLFDAGFFHADPHPGNLLVPNDPSKYNNAKVVLIDCGLMATIDEEDRDNMISAVIHLANKNYAALVDDFVKLNILPTDSNRATIIPLMDKALTPYVKGGGAKKYEEELLKLYGMEADGSMQSRVGGFQAMTQDALTVLQDVPFSIPPYFAILGRAIVTLEGVALSGNPDYGIIMEAYPFIARRLMKEGRPEIQKALQEVLYTSGNGDGNRIKFTRLLALLNNAAGAVSTQEGAAFVDLDTIPEDGLSLKEGLKFVLSDNAISLRELLEKEVDNGVDIVTRQIFRRAISEAIVAMTPPRLPSIPFLGDIFPTPPAIDEIPIPILLPPLQQQQQQQGSTGTGNRPTVSLLTIKDFTDLVAPKLSQDEEIYAISLADFVGGEIGGLLKGDRVLSPQSIDLVLRTVQSGALGRSDLLPVNNEVLQSVTGFVQRAWDTMRRQSNSDGSALEQDIYDAMNSLTDTEQVALNEIINEIARRSIERAVIRLSEVERIL